MYGVIHAFLNKCNAYKHIQPGISEKISIEAKHSLQPGK